MKNMNSTKSLPRSPAAWFAVTLAAILTTSASAQIHQLKELNTEQLRALPRDNTVVVMPGAYIGEHGPYLPCFVDGFRNAWLAQKLAEAIVERPGWHALVFPFIPIGQGGANEIGERHWFSGTFVVRTGTLRALFMDLAEDLGAQGFRWVFLMSNHGSPYHVQALDQAGDYFRDTHGGQMVNLAGLVGLDQLDEIVNGLKSEAERKEDGYTVHAGMSETSEALFLVPDLVSPAYKQAPVLTGRNWDDLIAFAKKEDWPGYFGSPRLGSAAVGARALKEYSARLNNLALEILDGRDYRAMPRFADDELKTIPADNATVRHEQAVARKQSDWLKRKTGASSVERIVRRYFEEWANRGDSAVADALIATNLVLRNPPAVINSLEDYKKGMAAFHAAFPDLRFTVEDLITEESKAVVRWTLRGTQRGEFQGRPATAKTMTVTGTSTFRLAGGKIQEIWVNMDRLGMQEQLGWLPAPPQPAK